MTNIDWAKPVETCEDPPRPVRVLATDGPCAKFPVIAIVGNAFHREFSLDGQQDEKAHVIPLHLRNVAAPKPEPVLREAWVVWDSDGALLVCSTKTNARLHGGVYARAAIMSDGSPVPGEGVGDPVKELIRWKQEHKCWKAKAEALQAEVDRMRPVVDAAVIYCTTGQDRGGEKLLTAIKRYITWEQRND